MDTFGKNQDSVYHFFPSYSHGFLYSLAGLFLGLVRVSLLIT